MRRSASDLRDMDWSEGILTIRGAKFGKSRLVPLHTSTCKVLADYAKRRDERFGVRAEGYFLVNLNGNRLDKGEVHRTFYILSRQIGLRGVDASRGPRLHDFRHRFAVETLLRWYRDGEDPKRRLPILSTYLGHAHVTDDLPRKFLPTVIWKAFVHDTGRPSHPAGAASREIVRCTAAHSGQGRAAVARLSEPLPANTAVRPHQLDGRLGGVAAILLVSSEQVLANSAGVR